MQSLFYCFSIFFVRFTVLLLYYRIFSHIDKIRIAIFLTTSAVVGITIGSVFTSIFQCTPIEYSWNKAIEGHCLDNNKHYVGGPMTSFLVDFIILVLPLRTTWSMQMPVRKKLIITFIFSVGGL